MSTNVSQVRRCTELYNGRDLDAWLQCLAEDAEFVDLAQGVTAKGREQIRAYGQGWIDTLSDAAYTEVRLTETTDGVLNQFVAAGVQDGPFGPFPPSGKRAAFPVTNVLSFNAKGEISRLEQLYDRMDVLIQLGHVPAPG